MLPTLIADDDSPDFPPGVEKQLLVGGPRHGENVEVIRSDRLFRTFAPTETGAYETTSYVRREIALQLVDGTIYARDVFVHEGLSDPNAAQATLLDILLTEFVKGGRKVNEGGVQGSAR